LIQFAEQYKGRYTDSVPSASKYGSRSYEDELAWANLWMYKATAQESYLDAAKNLVEIHDELQSNPKIFNVDTKVAGVQLLLAMEESADLTIHTDRVKNFCNFYVNDVPKTVRGLAFPTTFGATSVASSSSFLCILAAQKLPYEKIGNTQIIENIQE
jgi:endoglucanase